MKKTLLLFVLFTFSILPSILPAQTFSWQADTTLKYGNPSSTILFHTYLINNTTGEIRLRVIRTVNQLPPDWTSSFCVGGISGTCYSPDFDTIPDPVIINASSQIELAIDFWAGATPDQGGITVRIELWNNSSEFLTESFSASTMATVIRNTTAMLTGRYRLHTNYPNPFNPATTIPFEIGGTGSQKTVITVYNVVGQLVRVLLDDNLRPGFHQISWDGRDERGQSVSSGIYFLEMRTRNQIIMGKMFLLK